MPPKSKISLYNLFTVSVAILLPILVIGGSAWYLGFIFTEVEEYNDPCLRLYADKTCKANDKCRWNNKKKVCSLDSECMGAGQQNCGAGCHWDATVKKPGSNLYGLCRPATLASVGSTGTMEIK